MKFSIAGINENDWEILQKYSRKYKFRVNMSCPNIDSHFTNGIDMFNPKTRVVHRKNFTFDFQ